jgi:hypothetical protein
MMKQRKCFIWVLRSKLYALSLFMHPIIFIYWIIKDYIYNIMHYIHNNQHILIFWNIFWVYISEFCCFIEFWLVLEQNLIWTKWQKTYLLYAIFWNCTLFKNLIGTLFKDNIKIYTRSAFFVVDYFRIYWFLYTISTHFWHVSKKKCCRIMLEQSLSFSAL